MMNRERILALIQFGSEPDDSGIRKRTGIQSHQQVSQICRALEQVGLAKRFDGPEGHTINIPSDVHTSDSQSQEAVFRSEDSVMNTGNIVEIIGAVVDVQLSREAMPRVYDALKVENGLTLEVQQQIGDGVVRTIATGSTDGLQRGVGLDKKIRQEDDTP